MKTIFRFALLPFALVAELALLLGCLIVIWRRPDWADSLIRLADKLPSWPWYRQGPQKGPKA